MKLFHKIAITTLGLAMAAATGVGIARYNRSDVRMVKADTKTVTISYEDIPDGYTATTGCDDSLKKTVASSNDLTVQTRGINTKSKADAADHAYGYAMFLKDYGYIYSSTAPTGYYPSKVTANFGSNTGVSAKVGISFGKNALSERDTSVNGSVTKGGSIELENTDKTKLYWNFSTKGANVQLSSFVIQYKGINDADPTVTSVNVSAAAKQGTYKGFTTIQCSAQVVGTDNPSQDVVWTLSSTNSYVASQTETSVASIDNKGLVTFKDSGTVYAFATSTVTGFTSVRGSVACTANDLKSLVDYVQLDRTQRVKAGIQVAILNNAGDYALSKTQNTNNRAAVVAVHETVGDYEISHIQEDYVQLFTLVEGTKTGSFAFSYEDDGTKYLFASGSGGNNQLKTTSLLTDASSFMITISAGKADIISCDESKNGYLRYNYNSGSPMFSCYPENCNASLYIAGTTLPEIVELTSITNAAINNFEVYSSETLTASYLPVTATEGITVSATDNGGTVELGIPVMLNGTFSVSVKGLTAGSVTITLKGEINTSITTSKTFTVTPYNATHTKITSASALYNGLRVILGNATNKLASGLHTGGNNVPAVQIGFSEDGSTLSNVSETAVEYTMWQFTIAEKTGWAFYDNGYFLTATTGTNNYLKRTLTLSKYCLFGITYNDDRVSIVSVCEDVERNKVFCNTTNKLFSCYASNAAQSVLDLYSNNAGSTDAKIVAGFEEVSLKMDAISESAQGTGLCSTNHYYDFAKDIYNNTLTNGQKAMISDKAIERLEAWAAANGEHIDNNQLVSSNHVSMIKAESNMNLIIVVTSTIALISVAGFIFFLKKRKHQ